MAKRNQIELAADPGDGSVFDDSGFGSFELLKDYFLQNTMWKKTDLFSSIPEIPRRVRSKRKTTPIDGHENHVVIKAKESQNRCYSKLPSKREAESSDSEVICERSPCRVRKSTRQQNRPRSVEKWRKLDSGKFEFYMENMWRNLLGEKKNVFTYLDSLWFSLYSKGPLKEKVLSWIKKKDIFSKKYVFVPIVQWGHWFLLILCNFGESSESETKSRCMLLLDSMKEANSMQLEPGIRRFVFDIFKTEERTEKKSSINKIPLLIPQVPQQKNDEECGFYVLYYINSFVKCAPDNFSFSVGYPHFMKENWFTPEEVEAFIKRLNSVNKGSDCSN
ncbi:hypothetical protein CASFOL_005951 [Castilleja foliolosa]|uniref:Ubiquitin-like protease family profile domain-containing protein n=1 Tax=Castilleja foliolosa TaxID=1961234 RepID=A0ABD3E5B1_9LAMI